MYDCTLTLVSMISTSMSYAALLLLSQFSICSTLSGGSNLTTSVTMVLVTSCLTLRSIDWLTTVQAGYNSALCTSLSLSSMFIVHILLLLIEDMSTAFRTLSLGFRYAANSTAGHILLHIAGSLLVSSSILVLFISLGYVVLVLFECVVAVIQVGIYSVLILTYAGF